MKTHKRYLQDQLSVISVTLITVLLSHGNLAYGGPGNGGTSIVGGGSRHATCPPPHEIAPCTCKVMSKGLDIVCDNADSKHIFSAVDRLKKNSFSIYWMKFRSCVFPRIKDYIFLGLDVKHLNIIRSNVSVVERSSLSALGDTLTDLDLSDNNVHEIPTSALNHLRILSFLNLNYNKIQSLHEGAFTGLIMLERLSLYENRIKHIHDNAFKGIGRKLSRLNLGKNKLSEIPTDTFHPLVNLLVLDLNENKIKHLPDGAFLGLHKLDMLKLEHNEINTIQDEVFSDLSRLNSLNIEYNKIRNISEGAFHGLQNNLGWLEIGHNLLDHIPSHALRPLHNLRQLDLDSNKIHEVPEDAFKGYGDTLKFLLLDKNHIVEIPPLTFIDLHSLEWLKLSHNELKTLTEDTMQPILDSLTHIDVSNNPLVCNCEIYWLFHWLVDPINADNVESTDDHRCTTTDNKIHTIKFLSDKDFNCKRKITNYKPFEGPIINNTDSIEVDDQNQPRENVSERVITPKENTHKGRSTSDASKTATYPLANHFFVPLYCIFYTLFIQFFTFLI